MRLLNRETKKLEFFPDRPFPRYAILSHTWGPYGTEITFRDMDNGIYDEIEDAISQKRKNDPILKKKDSYCKLKYTCEQAKKDGLDYVWVDTCCIDKESSSELSESINSMFVWYKEAKICYAYMKDVPEKTFTESKWFTRGWTLQELIAPKNVIFYTDEWKEFGRRSELAGTISQITRIDEGILTGMQELKYTSVAKRMSWASDRQTTRQEDIAYCLMGLFDVNMAMLYGEGKEKAFRRLQEEIMKDSDDETLFAWTNMRKDQPEHQGLLATSPEDFRHSDQYIPDCDRSAPRVPATTTSKGLCVTLGLRRLEGDIWVGTIDCPVPPEYEQFLAIYLKRLDKERQQYARVKSERLCKIPQNMRGPPQTIYVRQNPLIPGFDDVYLHHVFQLRKAEVNNKDGASELLSDRGYFLVGTATHSLSKQIEPLPTVAPKWVPATCVKTFQIPRGEMQLAGALAFRRPDETDVTVMLGSKPGFGVAVDVIPHDEVAKRSARERESKRQSVLLSGESEDPLDRYFKDLELCFDPQPPGEWFDLGRDRFRIDVQPRSHAGIRYYMVDVLVEIKPRLVPEDLLNLGNLAPGLPNLLPEFVAPEPAVSDGHSRKLKNIFKSSSK